MTSKKIIPQKSIIVAPNAAIGRVGNYMFNIALCARVLYDIQNKLSNSAAAIKDYNKYLYFYCERDVPDGHGNSNAYHYMRDKGEESYHESIFKFNPLSKNDKISSITCHYENIALQGGDKDSDPIFNTLCMQMEKEQRLLFAKDADSYEIYMDSFPFIIEVLKFQGGKYIMIYINNCIYEGTVNLNPMYKNLYPINDRIVENSIMKHLKKILPAAVAGGGTSPPVIFIKLNFVILTTYINFHTDDFSEYFSHKVFGYPVTSGGPKLITADQYAKGIYKSCTQKYPKIKLFVSMHFRGGDYGDPTKDAGSFPVMGPQYYLDCIQEIKNNNMHRADHEILFIMFCSPGDLGYMQAIFLPHLRKESGDNIIPYEEFLGESNELISDQLNIYFMGLFDYMCISNSTYSWWSCYFSHNFNRKNKIYFPLLYKYPVQDALYRHYNHEYFLDQKGDGVDRRIILNNHICNALVFYGMASSSYFYILLKRYLREVIAHVGQTRIDYMYFKKLMIAIQIALERHNLSWLLVDDNAACANLIQKLMHFDKEDIPAGSNQKLVLHSMLSELYTRLFIRQRKKFSLEFIDTKTRFVPIKITEIMCTLDRDPVLYKNEKQISTHPVATIDHDVFKLIKNFYIENS